MNASLLKRIASVAHLLRSATFAVLSFASAGTFAQLEGTLFTQPEERAYLDYLRDEFLRNNAEQGFDIEEAAIPVIPGDEAAAPSGPVEFSFGGLMTRRDGSRSVWLNGIALAERDLPAGMSLVSNESSASLRIAHEGKVYMLRPGQTVDLNAGSVMENYQRPQAAPVTVSDAAQQNADVAGTESEATANDANADGGANAEAAADADEAASTSEPGITATIDALTSAVGELDDGQIAALVEALATLRPASAPDDREVEEDDEDDEAADAEDP